jgi:hypothetical protein
LIFMAFFRVKTWPAMVKSAFRSPSFPRILYRSRSLWIAAFLVALCAGAVFCPGRAAAQEELPQINPGERKIPHKKDEGPRAVALLKLSADGKASLVPIMILIDGKFWDAAAYKADPVPMALDSGTVYEAERTGESIGLFTVGSALHSKSPNVLSPWIGTGDWAPAGSEKPDNAEKAESVPVGIDNGDAPPRLTKDPSRVSLPKETPPASTGQAPSQSSGGSASGDEPPRLKKPAAPSASSSESGNGSSGSASSTGTAPAGSSAPAPGSSPAGSASPPQAGSAPSSAPGTKSSDAKPADAKSADIKPADAPKPPASDSGATDANRPRLRRGKPTQVLPDEEVPGYGKPGAEPAAAVAKAAQATVSEGQFELIPAISDAGGPKARLFGYQWLNKDEESDRRKQIEALARDQVRAYLEAQAKARISAVSSPAQKPVQKNAGRAPAAKSPAPILENVKLNTYDLWGNNDPVMVLSAEAHLPPAAGQTSTDPDMRYSITLVAYPDLYNNLHKIYSGVTDKYHLDLTPRLQLVDAVDADGDGFGELLFRETTDAGGGWLIYRASADKLWKMFDSLNPE